MKSYAVQEERYGGPSQAYSAARYSMDETMAHETSHER